MVEADSLSHDYSRSHLGLLLDRYLSELTPCRLIFRRGSKLTKEILLVLSSLRSSNSREPSESKDHNTFRVLPYRRRG